MPQLPLQRAECVIHHSVPPSDVAYDTLLLPAVASFVASCGGSRRWTALFSKVVQCLVLHDLAERNLATDTPPRSSRPLCRPCSS